MLPGDFGVWQGSCATTWLARGQLGLLCKVNAKEYQDRGMAFEFIVLLCWCGMEMANKNQIPCSQPFAMFLWDGDGCSLPRNVLRSLPQMQLCKLPSLTVSRVFSFAHCRNYQMKCTEYFDASEISWRRSDCPWMPWILPVWILPHVQARCLILDVESTAFCRGHLM